MLKQRVITAVILAPLAVAAVLLAPGTGFAVGLGAIILVAAWEWAALIPMGGRLQKTAFVGFVAAALLALSRFPPLVESLPEVGAFCWLLAAAWLAVPDWGRDSPALKAVAGLLVVLPCWGALVLLHALDPARVLFLLLLTWIADIGAYFAGKHFGGRKLAPRISPGKTWAGTIGGFVLAVSYAGAVGFLVMPETADAVELVLLSAVTVVIAGAGDLYISLMKRHRGVKDSGTILPGHGGVLDRLDSLFAGAPVFVAGMMWLGL